MEGVMSALLKLELLGRPGLRPGVPFAETVHCYSLKFMLEDIFLLVAFAVCEKARRAGGMAFACPSLRCPCRCCQRLMSLRLKYMFIGPAPRALFSALKMVSDGSAVIVTESLDLLRNLNFELNALFLTSFCLYIPQCLPCTWRRFLVLIDMFSHIPSSLISEQEWKTRFRRMADNILAAETTMIKNLRNELRRRGWEEEFDSWFPSTKQNVLRTVVWDFVTSLSSFRQFGQQFASRPLRL